MSSQQSSTSKLVAVLFADIEGYTALMQQDQNKAAILLRRFQAELDTAVKSFNGRVVNFYGDGALSVFETPNEAVRCAMQLNSNFNKEPIVPVRFGVHSGPVVFEGDKVFGNSVNITSRIESMGIPGAILLSDRVRRDIKNQPDIQIEKLGDFNFKNVEEPMAVFAIANYGFAVPRKEELKGKLKSQKPSKYRWFIGISIVLISLLISIVVIQKDVVTKNEIKENSIAVLPFSNMNKDEEGEFFCDGMMEDILTLLSKIQGLKVISRTSAMHYKGTTKKLPIIAKELGVAHILEGSVRKYGENARITVQLINASDDQHIWAENYDRNLKDIFKIQSEVAQQIVQALKVNITTKESKSLKVAKTADAKAYQFYMRGKKAAETRTSEGLEQSIQLFNSAINIDSTFADAYSNLGYSFFLQERYQFVDGAAAFQQMEANAVKALHFDSENTLAQILMSLRYTLRGDIAGARIIIDQVIESAPNSPHAYHASAQNYAQIGERAKEVIERKKAIDLDPLFWLYQHNYINGLSANGEFDKAQMELEKGKRLFPERMANFISDEGILLTYKKEYEEAIPAIENSLEATPSSYSRLGYCYGKENQIEKAKECLTKIRRPKMAARHFDYAKVYAGIENLDSVNHYLNLAVDQALLDKSQSNEGLYLVMIKRDLKAQLYFEEYRKDSRYQELMQKLKDVQ